MKHVHGPWSHSLHSNESNESVYWFTLLSAILLFPEDIFYLFILWGSCCQSKYHFSRTPTLTHPFFLCSLRNYSMMITIRHLVEPLRLSVSSFVRFDHKLTSCFKGCHFPHCWQRNCRGDKSRKGTICHKYIKELSTSLSLNTQQTFCIHNRGQCKKTLLVKNVQKSSRYCYFAFENRIPRLLHCLDV